MEITLVVCNVCGDKSADTSRYEIQEGERKVVVDLCAVHGEPLEVLMGERPTAKPRGPQRSAQKRGPRRASVTTMEEIERLKKPNSGD